jgi:hypothetical protein
VALATQRRAFGAFRDLRLMTRRHGTVVRQMSKRIAREFRRQHLQTREPRAVLLLGSSRRALSPAAADSFIDDYR